jgi:hypothetical protein
MHSTVERPYPFTFNHPNGEIATIDFIWGHPLNMAPVGITIWQTNGDKRVRIGEEVGSWLTFADARSRALVLAARWLGR